MRPLVVLCLWGMASCVGFSQATKAIYLNNETVYPAPLAAHARTTIEWPTNNCDGEQCYAILQFEDLPTAEQITELETLGIELHQYIPDLAYLASAAGPLQGSLPGGIYAIQSIFPIHKRPPGPIGEVSGPEGEEEYHLVAVPFPTYNPAQLAQKLVELGAEIVGLTEKWVEIKIAPELLPDLLGCPLLQYTEGMASEPVPEGRLGRSSGRLQQLNQGNGIGYDGTGVAMAIADDGEVNHLDFTGRLTDLTQYHTGDHADMTAGMAVGGGIINPLATGMAPGASLYLYDISSYSHINEAPLNYNQYGVVITSTSFGEGCGDSYNLATQGIDQQVYQNPSLLHFYSAGNHGTDACNNLYSSLGPTNGGYYFSTITGGRKAGKNVMAIGNTEYHDGLRISSSRGPTPDGRIKPDITAMGQGDLTTDADNEFRLSSGTSAASPSAAGAAADLYQYYREAHEEEDPSSALIKAALLNTAEDLGTPGPDYSYGWGRLHAGRALELLQTDQYFSGLISHSEVLDYPLVVPAGVERLKVMIYWHDPAGSTLSSRALVNDLDMRMETPAGQQLLPWTPSYAANMDSLLLPAQHRVDRVNNMEQIALSQPQAGVYTINLKGHLVPQGAQEFYVVYSFEYESLTVAFPHAGATLVPGEQNLIKWDAIGDFGSFDIAFSMDNGVEWQAIASGIPGDQRNYQWPTPSGATDQMKVRVRRGAEVALSAEFAVIAMAPEFEVAYLNDQQTRISWPAVQGAQSYEVMRLGATRMEVIGTTSDLELIVPAELGEIYWFSVRAVLANGGRGRRAIAQRYQHYGCSDEYNLVIQFDQYPGETSWVVLDATGNTMKQGGPYTGFAPHSQASIPICLPPGCYTFVMLDAYGDGICCESGNGWFNLYSAQGNSLLSGGDFNNLSYGLFCPDQNTPPLEIQLESRQHVSCYGAQDGAIQVRASGGSDSYTYQWNTGATTSGLNFLSAGSYTVTVSDGDQTASQTITIIQPLPLQLNAVSLPAFCDDGTINVMASGGTAPYNLTWGDGDHGWNRQELPAGDYYPFLTDANGCFHSIVAPVGNGAPLTLEVEVNNPFCSSASEGSIAVSASGGHGNYSYQWEHGPSSPVVSGLTTGQYSLTVTDEGGCQAEAMAAIAEPQSIDVNAAVQAVSCEGASNGNILMNVSGGAGPFTFNWSDGSQQPVRIGIPAGTYVVTITDQLGCSVIRGYQVLEPDPIQVQISSNMATQEQGGTIHLNVSGGTAPYSIQWSHGVLGHLLHNLAAGDYQATIIDAAGCQKTITTTVEMEGPIDNPGVIEYCDVQGSSTTYEWIEAINLNGSYYESGNDNGYGDFTSFQIPIAKNTNHQLELEPGFSGAPYHEVWRVWIDYNQDGDFDEWNETVVAIGPATGTQFVTLEVPEEALEGETRMRVAMQYGLPPSLCENVTYGEVEDYSIVISAGNSNFGGGTNFSVIDNGLSAAPQEWLAYPNPVKDQLTIQGKTTTGENVTLDLYDAQGRLLRQLHEWSDGSLKTTISMAALPSGVYLLRLHGDGWSDSIRLVKR